MKSEIQKTKLNIILRLALALLTVLIGIGTAQAGTLTVNTNADSNLCDDVLTLREAMLIGYGGNAIGRPLTTGERNQISGATFAPAFPPLNCSNMASYWSISSGVGSSIEDNIVFSTAVDTIRPVAGLPNITWAEDIINGLRSDGIKVAISGINAGNVPGLRIIATVGFRIRNLVIRDFQLDGLLIEGSDGGVYEGLEIWGNGGDGIRLTAYTSPFSNYNSTNNRIGGTAVSQRNLIYSNLHNGISIITSWAAPHYPDQGNVIENNYIGVKASGISDFGNGWDGIYLANAFGNRIGGDTAASRNVISGNDMNGIWIRGRGSYSNRIVNNFIGTNKDGNALIGNSGSGIALSEGAGNRNGFGVQPNMIGDVGQGNVIAGNYFGVLLFDSDTSENIIRANFIGTDLAASLNLGNVNNGIYINLAAHDNTIGGIGAGNENVIAYNGGSGVYIEGATTNNAIRRNRIFLNSYLGIDLHPFGVTVNDPGDFDSGPNNLQNYPLIGSGSSGLGPTTLSGSMSGTANTVFALDFFVSPNSDPSGYGEGSTYIGSVTVTTDNSGFAGYSSSFNTILNYSGFYATATATDPNGNTSEFSPATRIGCSYSLSSYSQSFGTAGGSGSFNVTTTSACDWQAVRSDNWITITGGTSGTGNGTVSFSVAANFGPARTGTITVGGRIFTITQASNCTYSLVSNTAGHPASGGSDGNSVIAPAGCLWTTVSNVSWITVTSGASSSGTASFTYAVAVNTGAARQGTLTVAGLTYTISQQSGCTYQLSHFSAGYPASGTNSDGVSITSGSGCIWTATSNAAWITINSGNSGNGNGSVTWSVSANTGAARQGTLTIANATFTINQSLGCTYFLVSDTSNFPAGGGSAGNSVGAPAGCAWTAVSNVPWVTITSGSSGSGNGSFTFSVAVNTGSARSGTMTIAGLTYTINQAAGAPRRTPFDFDGDGKTDVGVFRPSDGSWWYVRSIDSQFRVFRFGLSTDILTPGDFTGDGRTDIAVFRPSTGFWFIQRSEDNSFFSFPFGQAGDKPAPADYDGDGRADAAVFRPSSATWYILNSSGSGTSIVNFGSSGDFPAVADYDGDGKADIAIFRPSDGSWWYRRSSDSQFRVFRFGLSTDKIVPGDWTGDGKADIAVFRPGTSEWFIQRSEDNSFYSVPFGQNGDIPVAGDYDGDGKFDTAVFRPSTATWYVNRSSAGILITTFGTNGDVPIPSAFVP